MFIKNRCRFKPFWLLVAWFLLPVSYVMADVPLEQTEQWTKILTSTSSTFQELQQTFKAIEQNAEPYPQGTNGIVVRSPSPPTFFGGSSIRSSVNPNSADLPPMMIALPDGTQLFVGSPLLRLLNSFRFSGSTFICPATGQNVAPLFTFRTFRSQKPVSVWDTATIATNCPGPRFNVGFINLSAVVLPTDAQGSYVWTSKAAQTFFRAADQSGDLASDVVSGPFTLTVVVGDAQAALAKFHGDGQSGTVTKTLPSPLTVQVTDGQGNPKSGVMISFSTTSAPSGATGQTLSVVSAITAQDGTATTTLTFGDHVGTYTVTAACTSCAPGAVTFTAQAEVRLIVQLTSTTIQPLTNGPVEIESLTFLSVTAAGISVPADRVGNYPVVLISTSVALSGGHSHGGQRPTGQFIVSPMPTNVSITTQTTNSDGSPFLLEYLASPFGGKERIIAASAIDPQVKTMTLTITEEIPGLNLLPETTYYSKTGGTCNHHGPSTKGIPGECESPDDNHYVLSIPLISTDPASSPLVQLQAAARKFLKATGTQLVFNDMSLPSGGGFDLFAKWDRDVSQDVCTSRGHCWHRLGKSVDVENADALGGLKELKDALEPRGWLYIGEPSRSGTAIFPHFQWGGKEE